MKNKRLPLVLLVLIFGILLASCTSASTVNTWAGASITDSAVYVASGGQVFALKIDNGNKIWAYPDKAAAGRLFFAAPVVVGDQVIVGDYTGQLSSLSTRDGLETWVFGGAKGRYIDSPLVVGEMIIAPNADNHLYALDLQGNLKWTFEASHSFWTQPVSDGQNVYAASLDHYLYALKLTDGSEVWKIDLGGPIVSRPVYDNGIIYVGTLNDTMNAVDAAQGKIVWSQKLQAGNWSSPVIVDGNLYFGDQKTSVYILKASDGTIVKTFDVGAAVIGSGVDLKSGAVLFGTENGDLILVSIDGVKKWPNSVNGKIYSNLVTNGDKVLVLSAQADKPLIAYDLNGNEVWYFAGK